MTENDGIGGRKAAAQARQPALSGAGIVRDCDRSPADLDFQFGRQRAPQRLLIDVAVHGVDDRAERSHLLQRRGREEVTGMDNRLGCGDQLDAALRQPTGSSGHVGVGDHGNQPGRF